MSPRSEEFMAISRERAKLAITALNAGSFGGAVSAAYDAMLNAARAALSEEDRYAKTHCGTWHLFRETFVATGRFDEELLAAAEKTLSLRLGADYDAQQIDPEEASAVAELAARFVSAIEALYPD